MSEGVLVYTTTAGDTRDRHSYAVVVREMPTGSDSQWGMFTSLVITVDGKAAAVLPHGYVSQSFFISGNVKNIGKHSRGMVDHVVHVRHLQIQHRRDINSQTSSPACSCFFGTFL